MRGAADSVHAFLQLPAGSTTHDRTPAVATPSPLSCPQKFVSLRFAVCRPLLFVGNHQTYALDIGFVVEGLLKATGILPRGLAHPVIFEVGLSMHHAVDC